MKHRNNLTKTPTVHDLQACYDSPPTPASDCQFVLILPATAFLLLLRTATATGDVRYRGGSRRANGYNILRRVASTVAVAGRRDGDHRAVLPYRRRHRGLSQSRGEKFDAVGLCPRACLHAVPQESRFSHLAKALRGGGLLCNDRDVHGEGTWQVGEKGTTAWQSAKLLPTVHGRQFVRNIFSRYRNVLPHKRDTRLQPSRLEGHRF